MTDAVQNEDLLDELLACLDTLTQFLLYRTQHLWPEPPAEPVPAVPQQELYTALWQTVELVGALIHENDCAWNGLEALRGVVGSLEERILELKREAPLWTP